MLRARRPGTVFGCVVLCVVALSGCVGPATTVAAYDGKARRAAQDALSSVNTALLAVTLHADGRILENYFEQLLSQAEDDIGSVQTSFDSIQPPTSAHADEIRQQVDTLLSNGSDGVAQLRIFARRKDGAGLANEAEQLRPTATGLADFVQAHGG